MKNKNKQLNIRVSEQALNKIKDNAQKLEMSQTEYFEMIAINGIIELAEVNNEEFKKSIDKILSALDKIGINMNQIARKLNSGEKIKDEYIPVLNMCNDAFKKLYQIIDKQSERKIIFKNGGK